MRVPPALTLSLFFALAASLPAGAGIRRHRLDFTRDDLIRRLLLWAALLGWPAIAFAAEPAAVRYQVTIQAAEALAGLLTRHLDIVRLQDQPELAEDQFQRLVRQTDRQARDLLATEGYLSPRLESRIDRQGAVWQVTLTVEAGEPVQVVSRTLHLQGALALAVDREDWLQQLERAWQLRQGERFRQEGWDDSKKQLLNRLLSDGYPLAKLVASEAQLDPVTQQARLQVTLDSGPLVTLGGVQVEGLHQLPASLVKRLVRIKPGTPYRQSLLLDVQASLQATPYFSSVLLDVAPDPDQPLETPIRVKVREAPLQRVGFGVGYNTNAGARYEVNYHHANIGGHGWQFQAESSIETRRQFASTRLTAPMTAKGYTDSVFISSERSRIQGLDTRLRAIGTSRERDTGMIKTISGLSYEREWSRAGDDSERARKQALVASFGWTRRDLDHPVLPTSGNVVALRAAAAGRNLSSDTSFLHLTARMALYGRLPANSGFIILRSEAGNVFTERVSGVPSAWLFRAGGAQSIRGHEYQSIGVDQNGAVIGGAVYATAGAEYQYPLTDHWRWAWFVDAGDATSSWQEFALKRGYGSGVRWLSPVGSIAFDLAFGEPEQRWHVHLAIGLAF